MTTNKPEVKRYDCTNAGARHCYGCYTMTETEYGEYVSAEDFEALQAECAALVKALEGLERVAKVVSDNSDAVCGENNQLRTECEKLRKDAERYRWLRDGNDDKGTIATGIAVNCYGLEWDEAIDAAIAGDNTC